jgi:F0F1-type ATP synthase assembly protein I
VINNEDKKRIDWKPAFELFGQVSTWIIVPIFLALIVGKALDKHYGTEPWIFLGLTGFSFILSLYGIVRVVTKYMKKIEIQDKNIKDL